MDRGIWATWCNLPAEGRDEYLSWLHGSYIPGMLKRPGYLWAAHYAAVGEDRIPRRTTGRKITTTDIMVPRGDRYILLFGAEHSNIFGDPLPEEMHAALPAADRKMLGMRVGERVNIFTEAARVEGPEAKSYKDGINLAPCIQMGTFQARWQDEMEALKWYSQWRMPAMTKLAGCVRARKLASVAGWAKQSILYEFLNFDARNHFIKEHEDGNENREWTDKVIAALTHAPGSANVGERLWPPVGKA
jgi:hypothetical protein